MKLFALATILLLIAAPFSVSYYVQWQLQSSTTPPTPADLAAGVAAVAWTQRIAWTLAAVLGLLWGIVILTRSKK